MALDPDAAAVDHEVGPRLLAEVDVAGHAVEVLAGDEGAHLDPLAVAGADPHRGGAVADARDDGVARLAHRHHRRDRHAALAGRAVGGADEGVGGGVEVGVGQHHRVVLGPAEGLHPLAVGGRRLVDVPRHRRRPDERDGGDLGMRQQGVDRLPVAVHDVEDAGGQPRLVEQLGRHHARRGVLLRGLQHERVPAREGHRGHPHRAHDREVERGDSGADAEGLPRAVRVDPGPHVLGVLALQQVGDAARELDHLEAALHRAGRVGQRLAVLLGDDPRDVALALLEEVAEAHEDARPPKRRRVAPPGERGAGVPHRRVDVVGRRERHRPHRAPGRRVGDDAFPAAGAGDAAPVHPEGHGRNGSLRGHANAEVYQKGGRRPETQKGRRRWPAAPPDAPDPPMPAVSGRNGGAARCRSTSRTPTDGAAGGWRRPRRACSRATCR